LGLGDDNLQPGVGLPRDMTHLSITLFVGHQNGRSFFLNAGKGRCGVGAFFTLYIHFVDWNELDGLIALDWMRYLVPISARGGFSEIFWVIYALGGFWFGWMAVYARTWAGIWSQKKSRGVRPGCARIYFAFCVAFWPG